MNKIKWKYKYLIILGIYTNMFATNEPTWMTLDGKTKSFVKYNQDLTRNQQPSGFRVAVSNTSLGSADLSSKFNCKTGEIDLTAGIDSFINDFLQQFAGGNFKALLNELKMQTQIEMLMNIITRIHYTVVKNGFNTAAMKKMFDGVGMTKCIKEHMDNAFEGDLKLGMGTAKEDALRINVGINFVELMAIQACLNLGNDGNLEKEQWKKSHKWARHLVNKILNLALTMDLGMSFDTRSLACKDLQDWRRKAQNGASITDNPIIKQLNNKIIEPVVNRTKTYKELLTRNNQKNYFRKVNEVFLGDAMSLTGGSYKTKVDSETTIVGFEPKNKLNKSSTDSKDEEKRKEGVAAKEAGETKKESTDSETEAKEKSKKAGEAVKDGKIIKDEHHTIAIKYLPNSMTIDVFDLNNDNLYEIYEYIYEELQINYKFNSEREKSIYDYIMRKIFSIKMVKKSRVQRLNYIYEEIKEKAKKASIGDNPGEIKAFCTPTGTNFTIFDETKNNEKEIIGFLTELAWEANNKYLEANNKITKWELNKIINKYTYEGTNGNTSLNKEKVQKELMILMMEKRNTSTYKSIYNKDNRPVYVKIDEYLNIDQRSGKKAINISKQEFLSEEDSETNKYKQQREILKNTFKVLCMNALDQKQEKTFQTFGSSKMFDYQSFLLGVPDLIDIIRVLYVLEDPGYLYMFLSKTNKEEYSQLVDLPTKSGRSNYEIPNKMFYSMLLPSFKEITKEDLLFGIKTIKYIKNKFAITTMKVHGNMYSQLNTLEQVQNKTRTKNRTKHERIMYEFEIIRQNMVKRQIMLRTLLDKRN